MAAVVRMRKDFLINAMKFYQDKSILISSSCGVNALKLCQRDERGILSERVCKSCGQILKFGKTKRIRFKTKVRNRNFSMSVLFRLMQKQKKINYAVITCLWCHHRTYQPLTTFKLFRKRRLDKLKCKHNMSAVVKLKTNNTASDRMKQESKDIGLKTIKNLKQFQAKNQSKVNQVQQSSEVERLLGLKSSSSCTNIKSPNTKQRRSISNFRVTKFKSNHRKRQKRKA